MKQTVVFDFDGVIHSYTSGWKGATVIPDPPVPGIKEAIEKIRQLYHVVVVSSRCSSSEGVTAIMDYLKANDIVVDDVVMEKPPAVVYIDDRAIRFNGDPSDLLNQIVSFKPWNAAGTCHDVAMQIEEFQNASLLERLKARIAESAIKVSTVKAPHTYMKAVGTRELEKILEEELGNEDTKMTYLQNTFAVITPRLRRPSILPPTLLVWLSKSSADVSRKRSEVLIRR